MPGVASGERPAASPAGPPTSGAYPPAAPFGGSPRAGGTPYGGHSSGSYPAPAHASPSLADNKVIWIVLGVVALVAVIVLVVALSSGGDEGGGGAAETNTSGSAEAAGYTDEVQTTFVSNCAVSAPEGICECVWDGIVAEIPFDDFVAMDERMQEIALDPTLSADESLIAEEFPEMAEITTDCQSATTGTT